MSNIPKGYVISGAQLRELLDPKLRDSESSNRTMEILRRELVARTKVVGGFSIQVNGETKGRD